MENEFYNVICKVCKQEYIMDKKMDEKDSYICPACRFMGLKKKNNIKPNHYGNSGI